MGLLERERVSGAAMRRLLGERVEPRWEFVLVDGQLYGRDGDGWLGYPDYARACEACSE